MSRQPKPDPGPTEILVAALAGILFTTVWAILIGKDVGWDQKNYHYYGVYAWLHDRVAYHIQPAGQQTWLNPLVYLPHYWLINHAPPVVAGGIFGSWVGLNFALVYLLSRMVLPADGGRWRQPLAALCGAVGCSDPFFLQFIGSTDVDNLLSVPVLGSLCLLCWACSSRRTETVRDRAYAVAGLLLGAASGLKWVFFVYSAGMGMTLLALWRLLAMSGRRFLYFTLGGVGGFLLTGGFWSWSLWTAYGNPFFPYWNRYFRSPWAEPNNFRDMRFPPQSAAEAIQFPFRWFAGLAPSSEDPFRDARYAVLCVLLAVVAAALLGQWVVGRWQRGESGHAKFPAPASHWWLLLTFSLFSYLLWIKLFAIQRYLVPVGLLAGLLLWLLLDWLLASRAAKVAAFVFLAGFCILWTRIDVAGWRLEYGADWYGVELAPEMRAPETLFLLVGNEPMAYLVPFLPESARAVRLSGMMPETETELVRQARVILSQHRGPVRSLAAAPLADDVYAPLARFGLLVDRQACVQFRSAADQFTSCPVVPAAASAKLPSRPE
ncbi:MAG TPA: hypothetical protein VNN17_13150 [Terriglobia bacterium]|nr:hypothetical protein [Terriglobia bacterium]